MDGGGGGGERGVYILLCLNDSLSTEESGLIFPPGRIVCVPKEKHQELQEFRL